MLPQANVVQMGPMHRGETWPRTSAHRLAHSAQSFGPGDWFARAHSGAWTLPAKRSSRASKDADFGLFEATLRVN